MITQDLIGTATHPCPLAEADLWVLAGQSNMEGCGKLKQPSPSDPRVVAFYMDNCWRPAQDPLHRLFEAAAPVHRRLMLEGGLTMEQYEQAVAQSRRAPLGGVGSGLSFAREVAAATGRDIGLIACAHGGTSLAKWDPAFKNQGDDSLYGAMLERIAMTGGQVKGVLWYQGESDALEGFAPQFEQNMLAFVDALRRDTGIADLPFLQVQLGRFACPDPAPVGAWEQVREMQRRICRHRPNLFAVPAADLALDDPIHLAAEGQVRLGRRLAEVALTHVYNQPNHGTPLEIDSARIEYDQLFNVKIHLRVRGVSGRLRAEGRPDGFTLRSDALPANMVPQIFRIDFDAADPARLTLSLQGELPERLTLVHGPGFDPHVNITDERDMLLPTFELNFNFGKKPVQGETYDFTENL